MGVNIEFISPSMLVPKTDSNEYRLVTDFSALNVFLKKVPNTLPTIAQAKARIARANFGSSQLLLPVWATEGGH